MDNQTDNLKNPLTSLRSAVETLPLARNEDSRKRLLAVIEHDVKRLDRLISDVADAGRLDAELQRQEAAPVALGQGGHDEEEAEVGEDDRDDGGLGLPRHGASSPRNR